MKNMENSERLTITTPDTPFDFVAIKDDIKEKKGGYNEYPVSSIAGTLLVSFLEPFRDDEYIKDVEGHLDSNPNPVNAKAEMAYQMATNIWDLYDTWGRKYTPQEAEKLKGILNNSDLGPVPAGTKTEKGDSEYVGDIPQELKELTKKWLIDGVGIGFDETKLNNLKGRVSSELGEDSYLSQSDVEEIIASKK